VGAPSPDATAEERLDHALGLAFTHLGRRERTVAEVRAHRAKRDVDDATAEATVAELRRQDYLDDEGFATRFVEDKRTLEAWGRERIERGLLARGIDRECAGRALAGVGHGDELDAALALLVRRYAAPLEDPREARKAFGVLVRKGYDGEVAGDAVRAHARGDALS
jgi:regulatory protein